jgi:hypothetical protein
MAHGTGLSRQPPPETVAMTSNWLSRLAACSGCLRSICSTGRAKYWAKSLAFTVILPAPGLIQTRATAFLRLPVA